MTAGDEILTAGEVARLFRVDTATVSRWATAGKLRCFRTLGGHRRFRRADLEPYLQQRDGVSGRQRAPGHRAAMVEEPAHLTAGSDAASAPTPTRAAWPPPDLWSDDCECVEQVVDVSSAIHDRGAHRFIPGRVDTSRCPLHRRRPA